jgi:hypothetical protein
MNESEIVYGRRLPTPIAAWMALALGIAGPAFISRLPEPEEKRKCRLPGCAIMTKHNGGYCCPDHCKEHRRMKP